MLLIYSKRKERRKKRKFEKSHHHNCRFFSSSICFVSIVIVTVKIRSGFPLSLMSTMDQTIFFVGYCCCCCFHRWTTTVTHLIEIINLLNKSLSLSLLWRKCYDFSPEKKNTIKCLKTLKIQCRNKITFKHKLIKILFIDRSN